MVEPNSEYGLAVPGGGPGPLELLNDEATIAKILNLESGTDRSATELPVGTEPVSSPKRSSDDVRGWDRKCQSS